MKIKNDTALQGNKITWERRMAAINKLMRDGYGIPYLFDGRVNTEDDFDIKFKSDRHWHYFCWCLRNELDVFSDEVFHNVANAMRKLCEEGTKLSLPRGWTGKANAEIDTKKSRSVHSYWKRTDLEREGL